MDTRLQIPAGLRILLTLAAVGVVVVGMSAARPILVPVLFAAFLAIICGPAMAWLVQRKVPRPAALLLVFLAMATIGGTAAMIEPMLGMKLNRNASSAHSGA